MDEWEWFCPGDGGTTGMRKRGLSFLPTILRAEEVKAYEKDAKSNTGHNLLLVAKTSHLNNVEWHLYGFYV